MRSIKQLDIHVIEIPEREQNHMETEKIKKIMVENFPGLMTNINLQEYTSRNK